MQKLFRAILFVICIFLIAVPVFATETTTYHLEDVNISLDIPDDFIVFTRSSKVDDPNFTLYGITKDDLDDLFEERSIYLNAWDEEVNFEILVTMTDSSFEDFNLVSDTTLSALNSIITESFESRGAECIKSGIYQHSQAKFLRAYYRQVENDNTIYAIQYFTSYDGKAICIALRSTTGEIDASENNILNEIVDSVRFDVDPVKPEEPDHTPSFQYYDKDTGISFTVPDNWSQTEFNEERKFLTAKFSSNLEAGLYIIYSGADYWNELPAYEKLGKTRQDIDMSEISMQDFASMLGISSKDLSREYYDGKEYYKAVVESVENELGLDWPAVYLMHIENGYLAWFQFNGSDSSPYYKDFEAMVSSTEYPGSETSPLQDASDDTAFTPSFEYKDRAAGLSFTVPANWYEAELSSIEQEYLKAKFYSYLEPQYSISYSGCEQWNEIPSSQEDGTSNNNGLDKSTPALLQIADFFSVGVTDISFGEYNGKEYYKIATRLLDNAMDRQVTYLFRHENGVAYYFLFNGTESNPYYKDFESLVSSVNFLSENESAQQDTTQADVSNVDQTLVETQVGSQETTTGDQTKNKSLVLWIAIPSLIVLAIIAGFIFKKNGKKRHKAEILDSTDNLQPIDSYSTQKVETDNIAGNIVNCELADNSLEASVFDNSGAISVAQIPIIPKKIRFCRRCGNQLIEGSKFCNKCGTKIEEESSN